MISGTPPFTTAYASGSRYFGSSFENNAAVCSEISDGLMTAVLPAVMAPMSGKQQLKNGKFHGLYHIYRISHPDVFFNQRLLSCMNPISRDARDAQHGSFRRLDDRGAQRLECVGRVHDLGLRPLVEALRVQEGLAHGPGELVKEDLESRLLEVVVHRLDDGVYVLLAHAYERVQLLAAVFEWTTPPGTECRLDTFVDLSSEVRLGKEQDLDDAHFWDIIDRRVC